MPSYELPEGVKTLSLIRRGERVETERPDYRWWQELPGDELAEHLSAVGYEIVDFVRVSDLDAIRSQERQRAREEMLAGVESGDLTRTILEELEAPCDDPDHPSPQMGIQARIEGWFYATCWNCKKRVPSVDAADWTEGPCPANPEYEAEWCPDCSARQGPS